MQPLRITLGLAVALALLFGARPAPADQPSPGIPPQCIEGFSKGVWHLPVPGTPGFAVGKLGQPQAAAPLFTLQAKLFPKPGPSLAGIQGIVAGRLLDNQGEIVAFARGKYVGDAETGEGKFFVDFFVKGPDAIEKVGRMVGVFAEPPLLPALGQYKAKWFLCQ